MHRIPSILRLVPSEDTQETIPLQKGTYGLVSGFKGNRGWIISRLNLRVKKRTPPDVVVHELRARRNRSARGGLLLMSKIWDRIRPQQIAQQPMGARFLEAVKLYEG
jgi:hypothetical protein